MPDASNTSQNRIMTVAEVSQYLRLTERTIYTLLENGILPGAKFGNSWRVDREKLDQKLAGK